MHAISGILQKVSSSSGNVAAKKASSSSNIVAKKESIKEVDVADIISGGQMFGNYVYSIGGSECNSLKCGLGLGCRICYWGCGNEINFL